MGAIVEVLVGMYIEYADSLMGIVPRCEHTNHIQRFVGDFRLNCASGDIASASRGGEPFITVIVRVSIQGHRR